MTSPRHGLAGPIPLNGGWATLSKFKPHAGVREGIVMRKMFSTEQVRLISPYNSAGSLCVAGYEGVSLTPLPMGVVVSEGIGWRRGVPRLRDRHVAAVSAIRSVHTLTQVRPCAPTAKVPSRGGVHIWQQLNRGMDGPI